MLKKKSSLLLCCAALLLTACDPSLPPASPLPDAASPAAQLMVKRCGSCHGAPNPVLHAANEWPNVVFRMQKHMTQKGLPAFTSEENTALLEYLQKHARP